MQDLVKGPTISFTDFLVLNQAPRLPNQVALKSNQVAVGQWSGANDMPEINAELSKMRALLAEESAMYIKLADQSATTCNDQSCWRLF